MIYVNKLTNEVLTFDLLRKKYPNMSFNINSDLMHLNFYKLIAGEKPIVDLGSVLSENGFAFNTEDGTVIKVWSTRLKTEAEIAAENEAIATNNNQAIDGKIESLWSSTDQYIYKYISGVAIGLLTLGVLNSKPKAIAVQSWVNSIWTEYYTRKASITADSEVNLDFSTFGPIPYTVPELKDELGL